MERSDGRGLDVQVEPDIVVIGAGGYGVELVKNLRFTSSESPGVILIDRRVDHPWPRNAFGISLLDYQPGYPEGDFIAAGRIMRDLLPDLEPRLKRVSFAIIVAGLGGGAGSGVALELADFFRRLRIPVIAFGTKPHQLIEGRKRYLTARQAEVEIKNRLDCYISIDPKPTGRDMDEYYRGISIEILDKLQVLTDVLCNKGMFPVDFSRVKNAMASDGSAAIVTATASGENRARYAAREILADPLLEPFLGRRASIIIHMMSDKHFALYELDEAVGWVTDNWGAEVDLTYDVSIAEESGSFRLGIIAGDTRSREFTSVPEADSIQSSVSY